MTKISDIFAFATQNADYWMEFLSGDGGNYPAELTDDEVRAIDSANKHIDKLVFELLCAAGDQLVTYLGEDNIARRRFQWAATTNNRQVKLSPPRGLDKKLYCITFGLCRNEKEATIELYASLSVKKRTALDELKKSLDEKGIEYAVDNYAVDAPGLPLIAGMDVAELAGWSAAQAVHLLSGFQGPPAASAEGDNGELGR